MTLKSLNRKCSSLTGMMRNCLKNKSCSRKIRSLSETGNCGRMKICKIDGNRKQCARMASMGVRAGEEIDLICPEKGSKCIFKIHGGTISLDNDTTKTIFVRPV